MKSARQTYLQLACCDGLARLCSSSSMLNEAEVKEAFGLYFEEQEHFCLADFLLKYLNTGDLDSGKLIQVSANFQL